VIDESTGLLLIDVQQGFDDPRWGERNNPEAERNLARLLAAWRQAGAPVIHVQHLSGLPDSPLRPGQPGAELKAEVRPLPTEPVFQKQVNSAFIGTALETYLRQGGVRRLVMGGLTTDHCVSTTARMAANLGFGVIVVADGTATFGRDGHDGRRYSAEEVHRLALASLHGEFATVLDAAAVLAALGVPAT
jgi:nicotinamidase-related amidase